MKPSRLNNPPASREASATLSQLIIQFAIEKPVDALTLAFRGGEIATPMPVSFIPTRMRIYLIGVVSGVSLVSTTKTARSLAGSVLLALRLIEWIAPGDSDQLSPAR